MPKTLTAGQTFARDMRKNLGIGTRTRRFNSKKIGGQDMHRTILEAIANATYEPGYYSEQRQAIFRTAFAAYGSYEKHIAGYRASAELVSHINAMSPWQFCNLLGEIIDAGISNVGEGETFFRQMRERVFAPAAPVAVPVEVQVELSATAAEALGEPVPTAPRLAEQYESPAAPEVVSAGAEDERIHEQCAELARLVNTPADNYKGLQAGDRIEFHWPTSRHPDTAVVQSTCLWGALVHPEPGPDGVRACTVMYVRRQLDYGPHAGAWTA